MFTDPYNEVYNLGGWVLYNYTFDFISCIRDYYMYSGDEKTVRELWPFAKRTFMKNALNTVNMKQPSGGFMQFWVDKAVFMSGLPLDALKRIRWYFGYIFTNDSTTCWEKHNAVNDYIPLREDPTSLCHG